MYVFQAFSPRLAWRRCSPRPPDPSSWAGPPAGAGALCASPNLAPLERHHPGRAETVPSGVFDSILLRDSWSTEELRRVFSDENRVQKWYEVEAMLASEMASEAQIRRIG
jgi:hypothetical protein